MASETGGRRLLAALAGSTSAFTQVATASNHFQVGARLLAALGDTTPAFSDENTDEYTSPPVPQTYEVYSVATLLARKSAIHEFAEQLRRLSPQARLAARAWLPIAELERVRTDLFDGNSYLYVGVQLARSLARALDPSYLNSEDLRAELGNAQVGLLRHSVNDRDTTLFESLGRAQVASLVLEMVLESQPPTAEPTPPTFHLAVVRDITFVLTIVLNGQGRDDVRDVGEAVGELIGVVSNMVDADLTTADLTGIPLTGVRWSVGTRWPPDWAPRIQISSVLIAPGLYEIRPGLGNVAVPVR